MSELRQLDYFLLSYAPYPLRDDSVTFGVVLREASGTADGFAGVRFTQDWRMVRCLNPAAEIDCFEALQEELQQALRNGAVEAHLLTMLHDSFSLGIRVSPPRTYLAEDPAAELEMLCRQYIETPRRASRLEPSGRQKILRKMRAAFEDQGIWGLLRKEIPADEYTLDGDPLKIDVAYQPNGVVKMLQAVSLAVNVDAAKSLAFSYPALMKGIKRKTQALVWLTAVVEDDLDRREREVSFALRMMEGAGIRVATTLDLPLFAKHARLELHA